MLTCMCVCVCVCMFMRRVCACALVCCLSARPLHHAAHKGQLEAVKLLCRTGLLDTLDNDKCTPLHRAVLNPACVEVRVTVIACVGACLSVRLYYLARGCACHCICVHLGILFLLHSPSSFAWYVQAIMSSKPPSHLIDAQDKRGCTAFLLAAAQGVEMAVDLLVHGGASTTECDKRNRNALMMAAHGCVPYGCAPCEPYLIREFLCACIMRSMGFALDAEGA